MVSLIRSSCSVSITFTEIFFSPFHYIFGIQAGCNSLLGFRLYVYRPNLKTFWSRLTVVTADVVRKLQLVGFCFLSVKVELRLLSVAASARVVLPPPDQLKSLYKCKDGSVPALQTQAYFMFHRWSLSQQSLWASYVTRQQREKNTRGSRGQYPSQYDTVLQSAFWSESFVSTRLGKSSHGGQTH